MDAAIRIAKKTVDDSFEIINQLHSSVEEKDRQTEFLSHLNHLLVAAISQISPNQLPFIIKTIPVTGINHECTRTSYIRLMNKESGFTLVELLITVVVLAIVLSIGIPSFRESIMNNRITSAANEFASSVLLARTEAIKRSEIIVVRTPDGTPANNEWGQGFSVALWTDTNIDGFVAISELGTLLRQVAAFGNDVTLDSDDDIKSISFTNTGALNGTAELKFKLCDTRTGVEKGRELKISPTGAYTSKKITCP